MTDVTPILVGLILIIFGVIARFGIPFINSKLSTEQLNTLQQVVRIAVYAADQLFGAKMGTDKKAFALDYAEKLLAKLHLSFEKEAVSAAIEAQVKELKITENG